MKVLVSLILSAVMLNLAAHARSSRKQRQIESQDMNKIDNPLGI